MNLQKTRSEPRGARLGPVVKIHGFRPARVEGPDRGREWLTDRDPVRPGSGPESDVQRGDETISRPKVAVERTPHGWRFRDRAAVQVLTLGVGDERSEPAGLAAPVDREKMERVLRELDGNRTIASPRPGNAVSTLWRRMRKYGPG